MPGQPVKLGPFVGGMNTYSGPASIADNEAVEILNMDVDLDGSLVSRPGLPIASNGGPASERGHIIGLFRDANDVVYYIFSYNSVTHYFDTSTNTLGTIGSFNAKAAVQYNDKLYLVLNPVGTTQGGYSWTPAAGAVAIAAMPRGYSAVIYKERMFISASRTANEDSINRIKFSNASNPEAWTSTDYFDVAGGDGQDINALAVFDSQITIFKSDSTYAFAYETAPTKGIVQMVSNTIGANNQYSVKEYENNLFVMHEDRVYRISNWNWEHANIKVPFVYINSSNVTAPDSITSLSIIGNRLVCRYYDSFYVLGLKTGAWVKWQFSGRTPSEFVVNPNISPSVGAPVYTALSYSGANQHRYVFKDVIDTDVESMTIRLISKAYDFGPSYGFKRLFWWGVDTLSRANTTYKVTPLVYNTPVTWGQISTIPFNQLQTWGRPLEVSLDVTDSANTTNPSGYRTFIKLLKGLRFRQASFTIEATTDGTTNTGPYRIFSLTGFVDSKEIVSKKVS